MKASGPRAMQSYDKLPPHIKQVAGVPARIDCMKCRKKFNSPDKLRIRVCPKCAEENAKEWCSRSVPLEEGVLEGE